MERVKVLSAKRKQTNEEHCTIYIQTNQLRKAGKRCLKKKGGSWGKERKHGRGQTK